MAKEYIEREALQKELQEELDFESPMYTADQNKYINIGLKIALRAIKKLPAPDVVEVVRCKDCKHWHEDLGWCDKHSHFIKYDTDGEEFCHPWESTEWKMFDADYWCADGERRDNDADR